MHGPWSCAQAQNLSSSLSFRQYPPASFLIDSVTDSPDKLPKARCYSTKKEMFWSTSYFQFSLAKITDRHNAPKANKKGTANAKDKSSRVAIIHFILLSRDNRIVDYR